LRELESALKPARLAGAGSLNPKKDGPLIGGVGPDSEAGGRTGSAVRGRAGADTVAAEPAEPIAVRCDWAPDGSAASSVAPHMPQKRLPSGFSLPHRAQRTDPPVNIYSLRYLRGSMQSGTDMPSRKFPFFGEFYANQMQRFSIG
jgi:hypothetical protein